MKLIYQNCVPVCPYTKQKLFAERNTERERERERERKRETEFVFRKRASFYLAFLSLKLCSIIAELLFKLPF